MIFVSQSAAGFTCPTSAVAPRQVASWTPEAGFLTRAVRVYRVPRSCWFPPAADRPRPARMAIHVRHPILISAGPAQPGAWTFSLLYFLLSWWPAPGSSPCCR